LRAALLTIDEATLKGKRDRALLLLGFAGPLRRLRRPQRKRREHVHRKSQGETHSACVPGDDSTCVACWRDSTAGVLVLEIVRLKPAENAPILGHANVADGTTSHPRFVR